MANLTSVSFLFCCLFQILSVVFGIPFVLDVEHDVDGDNWAISGNTLYVEYGRGLRQAAISQFLPGNFQYSHFDLTPGIWAVVPDKNKPCAAFEIKDDPDWDNWSVEKNDSLSSHSNEVITTSTTTEAPPCDVSSSGSFQFIFSAQLLSTVAVRYNFGGNASIRVTRGSRQPFQIFANYFHSDNWANLKVKNLEGRLMILEAIVNGTNDYVLIDRITVESLQPEPTNATTTTPPTTKRPRTKSPKTPSSHTHSSTSTESSITTTAATDSSTTTEEPSPPTNGQNGPPPTASNMIIASYLVTVGIIQLIHLSV